MAAAGPDVFGFLNVDKPLGLTSHDVIARLRRTLHIKRMGHAGTLDPLATGVLVVCVGAATRLSEYVMASQKVYRATVRLGQTTTTYDAEGEITEESNVSAMTQTAVDAALQSFIGPILQVPPVYSAIKQGGRKLYAMARAGEAVTPEPRPVHIAAIYLRDWAPPLVMLEVHCGAGTYIRSLAHDLGQRLGVGAHLAGLVRLASGRFRLHDAISLDALVADADWRQHLLSPLAVLDDWPQVMLDGELERRVRQGQALPIETASADDTPALGLRATDSALVGVLRAQAGRWLPHKVFSAADDGPSSGDDRGS